jgi:hypothetical protein
LNRTRPRNSIPGPADCDDAGSALTPGRMACALVVVVCVLAVFLFPAVQGPYSAVHGPVTALHAARAAAGLRMAMAGAGLICIRIHGSTALILRSWAAGPAAEFPSSPLAPGSGFTLRC